MAAARISKVAFPPSPIHLFTAFKNDWLSHKYSNGSSIGVTRSASKKTANSGRFELTSSSSRPTLHCCFSFFFSSYDILLPFCLFCLNRHLPLLGPETHSLRACLSLCPSSNCVLSLSIALDIRLFYLIYRPLSAKLIFSRLPHGNLGEPNTKHTVHLMRIWCCSVATTLSTHWLPFASLFIHLLSCFGFCLPAVLWENFFYIGFKRALLFVFFPRPVPNHPILRIAHLFRPLLLLWFRSTFPYYNGRSIILSPKFQVTSSSRLKKQRGWHYCLAFKSLGCVDLLHCS